MADDLDIFLNEIERRLGSNGSGKAEMKEKCGADYVAKIFDERDFLDDDFLNDFKETSKSREKSTDNALKQSRCFEIFVGGSQIEMGLSTPLSNKPCSSLRCTACDFVVSTFDGFQWNRSVDYLFLRNNMPEFNKLKDKFQKKPGSRAYACQCVWLNSVSLELLKQTHPHIKWVCGKH